MPCLIKWFSEKNILRPIYEFNCPSSGCSYIYTRSELTKLCNYLPYEIMLSEILLKEYLRNEDIRPCPKCSNYGFVDHRCNSLL